MKKYKWYVAFAAVIISVLTLYLINYIVINKTYATPEESFLNSAPNNSSLINIIEHDDINVLVYKKNNGEYFCNTIYKTDKGWASMKRNISNSVRQPINKYKNSIVSFVDVMYINDKYFVNVCYRSCRYKIYFPTATISDSISSEFSTFSSFDEEYTRNGIIVFSLVMDSIPENYYIITGNTRIDIKS